MKNPHDVEDFFIDRKVHMDIKTFNQLKLYSDANGVSTIIDPNIKMVFNQFGLYEEYINPKITDINDQVKNVMSHLYTHTHETKIGKKLFGSVANIKYDQQLGYYKHLYAGYVKEGNYREIATAGGIATWLFSELFNKNLIDGVIHVKKNKDENSEILFKYDISYSVEEIKAGAKSKYYPVEMSEVLNIVKNKPGRYAVIGSPSFIMSLRLLCQEKPLFKDRIRFMIGLIVGHHKSARFAESIAWQVGIKPGDLKYIDFRKSILDKPASKYAVELEGYIDGHLEKIIKPMDQFIDQDWGGGYFKAIASDYLDDVFNETADITLGDAWLDRYDVDPMGTNVVITRNETIDQIMIQALKEQRLHLDSLTVEQVRSTQTSHYRHTHDELSYRLLKLKNQNKWYPSKRVNPNNHISDFRKKVQDFREMIRDDSHLYYLKARQNQDFKIYQEQMIKRQKAYKELYRLKK